MREGAVPGALYTLSGRGHCGGSHDEAHLYFGIGDGNESTLLGYARSHGYKCFETWG